MKSWRAKQLDERFRRPDGKYGSRRTRLGIDAERRRAASLSVRGATYHAGTMVAWLNEEKVPVDVIAKEIVSHPVVDAQLKKFVPMRMWDTDRFATAKYNMVKRILSTGKWVDPDYDSGEGVPHNGYAGLIDTIASFAVKDAMASIRPDHDQESELCFEAIRQFTKKRGREPSLDERIQIRNQICAEQRNPTPTIPINHGGSNREETAGGVSDNSVVFGTTDNDIREHLFASDWYPTALRKVTRRYGGPVGQAITAYCAYIKSTELHRELQTDGARLAAANPNSLLRRLIPLSDAQIAQMVSAATERDAGQVLLTPIREHTKHLVSN